MHESYAVIVGFDIFLLEGELVKVARRVHVLWLFWFDIDALVFMYILSVVLPEEIGDEFVIVYDLILFVVARALQFFEEAVDVFGVELEVVLHFLHPRLVHLVEVHFHDVSDFEVDH